MGAPSSHFSPEEEVLAVPISFDPKVILQPGMVLHWVSEIDHRALNNCTVG